MLSVHCFVLIWFEVECWMLVETSLAVQSSTVQCSSSINYNKINQKRISTPTPTPEPDFRKHLLYGRDFKNKNWQTEKPGDKFSIGRSSAFATKMPHKSDNRKETKIKIQNRKRVENCQKETTESALVGSARRLNTLTSGKILFY